MGAVRIPPLAERAVGRSRVIAVRIPAWLHALRPAQWIKNSIVPAAYFFAWRDPSQSAQLQGEHPLLSEGLAVICFCALSSAVYLINDLRDREADRAHPIKRLRPLAAGTLSLSTALALAGGLAASSLLLACVLPRTFSLLLVTYALMQMAYTFLLKRIAYVDVFIIAIGFVLRAAAGAAAITVRISPWLLLCTFLLALFLALCKRRHEKRLLEDSETHREALGGYDRQLLDIQISIVASATTVCYAIYTLAPETIQRFGTNRLGFTVPFVLFGLFRYLSLVYQQDEGNRPEKVLLTDKILIITVLGFLATAWGVFLTV